MYKRTILTEKELQEEAARIMNSENDDSLSDILEPDEIPEMFLDSGSSYKPSSESGSSVEQNPVSDSEHTSDEAVSDLDENVPEMDSAPVNNQDDSDWLEIDDEPEVFDFSEIERLKIDISKECTPKDIFELLFDDDLFQKICEWINLRALSVIGNVIPKHSTMNKWKPTTPHEFRRFLALCMLLG
uniref:PiggyBac transposable element-derived protein 4-like n=1 Tax=Diabrotica virgifera virgifera TaxID=50390 RepID=A0A6P7GY96_DIAVI